MKRKCCCISEQEEITTDLAVTVSLHLMLSGKISWSKCGCSISSHISGHQTSLEPAVFDGGFQESLTFLALARQGNPYGTIFPAWRDGDMVYPVHTQTSVDKEDYNTHDDTLTDEPRDGWYSLGPHYWVWGAWNAGDEPPFLRLYGKHENGETIFEDSLKLYRRYYCVGALGSKVYAGWPGNCILYRDPGDEIDVTVTPWGLGNYMAHHNNVVFCKPGNPPPSRQRTRTELVGDPTILHVRLVVGRYVNTLEEFDAAMQDEDVTVHVTWNVPSEVVTAERSRTCDMEYGYPNEWAFGGIGTLASYTGDASVEFVADIDTSIRLTNNGQWKAFYDSLNHQQAGFSDAPLGEDQVARFNMLGDDDSVESYTLQCPTNDFDTNISVHILGVGPTHVQQVRDLDVGFQTLTHFEQKVVKVIPVPSSVGYGEVWANTSFKWETLDSGADVLELALNDDWFYQGYRKILFVDQEYVMKIGTKWGVAPGTYHRTVRLTQYSVSTLEPVNVTEFNVTLVYP